MPGQHEHRGAQAQPARARAEPGQQVERGRDLAIAGEVVLDDERTVEAERLGLNVVVDEIAEPLTAVELGTPASRRRTAEQAELHGLPPLVPRHKVTAWPAIGIMLSRDRRRAALACLIWAVASRASRRWHLP